MGCTEHITTPHHISPHRTAPHRTTPHHTISHHITPHHISPYTRFLQEFSATLAGYLPGLWATAGASPEYGMLRTSIVRSYVKLVEALRSENEEFYEFLCTVVLHSIDTTQPQHEYLLEDGMELWHRTVQFAPAPTKPLFELFGYVTHLMDREDDKGESTKTCVSLRSPNFPHMSVVLETQPVSAFFVCFFTFAVLFFLLSDCSS